MLNPAWIIQKKRDGKPLLRDEIRYLIEGSQNGNVADYQLTAFLMAVYFRGMSAEETAYLTEAMLDSGERHDLSHLHGPVVDKHSTGGVGDKVSLILAPLAASCGLQVPMMSGRGLGHSGGTLDKLESIPGFDVHLSKTRYQECLSRLGCAMIGQSEKIVPADRKLYSLRDVTATVECIPLIVASILSKKLAEGTRGLILDVKAGSGAFMKSRESARKLAKALNQTGKKMGLKCRSLITNMNQPLGYAVGNAIEVREAIEVMRNQKHGELSSCDLKELTLQLCAHMLEIGGVVKSVSAGRRLALTKLQDGSAWKTFLDLVRFQGGDVKAIQEDDGLPLARHTFVFKAKKRGYIVDMETESIGRLLVEMGGGRRKASDSIHREVGIAFHRKLGAPLSIGDAIATFYLENPNLWSAIESEIGNIVKISSSRKAAPRLVFEVL